MSDQRLKVQEHQRLISTSLDNGVRNGNMGGGRYINSISVWTAFRCKNVETRYGNTIAPVDAYVVFWTVNMTKPPQFKVITSAEM